MQTKFMATTDWFMLRLSLSQYTTVSCQSQTISDKNCSHYAQLNSKCISGLDMLTISSATGRIAPARSCNVPPSSK